MISKKHNLIIIFLAIVIGSYNLHAQSVDGEKTKMDALISRTGVLVKFIDYSLPPIPQSYGTSVETRIRKFLVGTDTSYFYQISVKEQYGKKTASIEYSDLLELMKAVPHLKSQAGSDVKDAGDYLENRFVTNDGVQIGYYIDNGKVGWYIKLDKYGSDNTVFLKDVVQAEQSFLAAKTKIEALSRR